MWQGLMTAVRLAGEDLLGRGQRDAPVDEGTLRASGYVDFHATATTDPRHGSMCTSTVVFPMVYAARQHEEESYAHPKGGKAKYLEDPLKEMAGHYAQALAAHSGRAFGGVGAVHRSR